MKIYLSFCEKNIIWDMEMYYKIKNKVLFRQFDGYGYLTDNSLFGYHFLNDKSPVLEEKYVSETGAMMLSKLSKELQSIDTIVAKLENVFIGVELEQLRIDTIDFFNELVKEGYLLYEDTIEYGNLINEIIVCEERIVSKDELNQNVPDKCFKCKNQKEFLRSIHVEIANECNERCIHCYIPHECKNQILEPNLFYKIVDQGRAMNIINVTISGGEPLLHKDILNFLSKCRELDLSVNLLSNLTLINDEMICEMKKNPLLCVQTSLYSMNASVHDSITQVDGSFEKTKAAVLKLIFNGIPVQISCPIMKQNKNSFFDVIQWGKEHNISVLYDYVIFASYDHSNANLKNRLTLEEVEEAFKKQLSFDTNQALIDVATEKVALTDEEPICSIGRYYFCISPGGEAYPCVGWQNKVIGNVNFELIKDIWESSKEMNRLRSIKRRDFPKCVFCKDRGYCTVCMMSNSNENRDGDCFKINEYHCKVAAMIHSKICF